MTRQSAHGMQLSASALEDLRKMASELRDGVADFVLPSALGDTSRQDDMVGRPLLKKRDYSSGTRSVQTAADTVAIADSHD